MTVQIDALNAVVFVAGCVVAYFVYKHTRKSHPGPVKTGDPGMAIGAGLSVILALGFLLGVSGAETDAPPTTVKEVPTMTADPSERAAP
ncbi:hypothetical protein ACIP3U_35285 [[Kitasatospora] papulosa]|uniref:hypothetical protein n=1 Tax=[Kitasatospora] papulosa TaxID=1464011 RepID=UPI00380A7FF8